MATSKANAMALADRLFEKEISWSDGWHPTDAQEAPSYDGEVIRWGH